MPEPIALLSHEALDELVDTDPIRLRDVAYAMRAEVERLNARVAELTSLLNDPDRLALHALELRAIYAEADADAERDCLADGGDL